MNEEGAALAGAVVRLRTNLSEQLVVIPAMAFELNYATVYTDKRRLQKEDQDYWASHQNSPQRNYEHLLGLSIVSHYYITDSIKSNYHIVSSHLMIRYIKDELIKETYLRDSFYLFIFINCKHALHILKLKNYPKRQTTYHLQPQNDNKPTLVNLFDLRTSPTTRTRTTTTTIASTTKLITHRNITTSGSGAGTTLIHLRDNRITNTFQFLKLILKLINLRQLIPFQPPNSFLHSFLNLLLITLIQFLTKLLIPNSVPHIISVILQPILSFNLPLHLFILSLIPLCIFNHLFNIFFAQSPLIVSDRYLVLHSRRLIFSRNVKDSVSVYIENNVNLRHTSRRRRDSGQFEFSEQFLIRDLEESHPVGEDLELFRFLLRLKSPPEPLPRKPPLRLASRKHFSTGSIHLLNKSIFNSSNLALTTTFASLSRKRFSIASVISLSPAVALTSKIPSSIVKIETSKVPPPRSKIRTFCSPTLEAFLSNPYAIAAAVGSLMILNTFNPEIAPASFVACRCESLKYAGTVTTAFLTE
ncbi:hypothetical protein G4B88_005066 [Cannabis sativa]|uniref:Uncharacterized protein n=1 Tax=Cannabis sativa TaxID=3483 RepID=A0A7J6H655_CANSA|nr:hypothetical protein G4B88_005066 [Cannabis sativa]